MTCSKVPRLDLNPGCCSTELFHQHEPQTAQQGLITVIITKLKLMVKKGLYYNDKTSQNKRPEISLKCISQNKPVHFTRSVSPLKLT